jgi:hypothetical protein
MFGLLSFLSFFSPNELLLMGLGIILPCLISQLILRDVLCVFIGIHHTKSYFKNIFRDRRRAVARPLTRRQHACTTRDMSCIRT